MSNEVQWDDDPIEWGGSADETLTPFQRSMSGVVQGATDPLYGTMQLVGKALSGVGAESLSKPLLSAVTEREKEFQSLTGGEAEGSRLAGAVLSPVNLIPGGVLALPGRGALTQGAKYAASGAISGAMQPVTEGDADYWGQKGNQTLIGGLAGVALPSIFNGMANLVKQGISKESELLQKAGVRLTPGQALGGMAKSAEDKMISLPLMGDAIRYSRRMGINEFNKAAYDRALAPIGKEGFAGSVGPEGMTYVRKTLGQAYDDLLPNLGMKLDGPIIPLNAALPTTPGQTLPTVRQELNTIRNLAASSLPKNLLNDFDNNIMQNVIGKRVTPQGNPNKLCPICRERKGFPADHKKCVKALREKFPPERGKPRRQKLSNEFGIYLKGK